MGECHNYQCTYLHPFHYGKKCKYYGTGQCRSVNYEGACRLDHPKQEINPADRYRYASVTECGNGAWCRGSGCPYVHQASQTPARTASAGKTDWRTNPMCDTPRCSGKCDARKGRPGQYYQHCRKCSRPKKSQRPQSPSGGFRGSDAWRQDPKCENFYNTGCNGRSVKRFVDRNTGRQNYFKFCKNCAKQGYK